MNIAFIGTGGVGGYFGGKLSQLIKDDSENFNLYFVARGVHLEQIRKKGLRLKTSDNNEMICKPTMATDNIKDLPKLDICFICVKQYDLDNCLEQLKDKIGKNTQVVPLLNGVDIYDRIRKVIKEGVIFPACVYVGTHIEAPGVVSQSGGSCTIVFGKDPKNKEVEPSDLCNLMSRANIKFQWSEKHIEEIWSKYIFIASYGLVTASENKTLGEVFEDKELSSKVLGIMKEIVSISKAEGVKLSKDIVEKSYNKAKDFPFETKTSFQRDYEKKINRDERELFGQTIINLGKKYNISTKVTESVYKKLNMDNINFSKIAEIYENNSLVQKSAADTLIELLCMKRGDKILDVGCGTGNLTRKIKELTCGEIIGIDAAEGMIEKAKERNKGLGIDFQVSSTDSLDYTSSFDIIFCNSVFQWLNPPEKSLRNFYKALAKEGKIGIQAPATSLYCPNFVNAVKAMQSEKRTKNIFEHFKSPWFFLETAEEYSKLFSSYGFNVLFSKLETITTNYTAEEVFKVFSSGAAAGYLNQAFYDVPIDDEYINDFKEIVFREINKQADSDGYVSLTFNRIYLVAQK